MERKHFEEVLAKYATPSYVFDLDILRERVMLINKYIGDVAETCYAMKANPFVIAPMDGYVDKFEVCSPGEYEICMRNKIDPAKIVVSGVNKTVQSMDRIVSLSGGKGVFTIESIRHYEVLEEIAAKYQVKLDVLIRLSSGNQFGVDKANLELIAGKVAKSQWLSLSGMHFYSGTQKKLTKVEKEIRMLDDYAGELADKYGISGLELEYGPGLSVTYFESDAQADDEGQLKELKEILTSVRNYAHITIEMGRFIATHCGYFITKVIDVKQTEGHNYCIVDGGIHQLNYFGQLMGMKRPYMELVSECKEDTEDKWNICGSLCTVNDVIVKDALFPTVHRDDAFVFKNCGAYSVTEGMALFLSRELPQVLFYSGMDGFSVVRELTGTDYINSLKL